MKINKKFLKKIIFLYKNLFNIITKKNLKDKVVNTSKNILVNIAEIESGGTAAIPHIFVNGIYK